MRNINSVGRPANGPVESLIAKFWFIFFCEAANKLGCSGRHLELVVKNLKVFPKSKNGNYIYSGKFTKIGNGYFIPSNLTIEEVAQRFGYDFTEHEKFLVRPFFSFISNPDMNSDDLYATMQKIPGEIISHLFTKFDDDGIGFQRHWDLDNEVNLLKNSSDFDLLTTCLALLIESKKCRTLEQRNILSCYAYDIFVRVSLLYPFNYLYEDLFTILRPFFFTIDNFAKETNKDFFELFKEERFSYSKLIDLYQRKGIIQHNQKELQYFLSIFDEYTYSDTHKRFKYLEQQKINNNWEVVRLLKHMKSWRRKNRAYPGNGPNNNKGGSFKPESLHHIYQNQRTIPSEYALAYSPKNGPPILPK